MICSGTCVATGEAVTLEIGETIRSRAVADGPSAKPVLLAPGFIDLQVNGFAGVDFNDPAIDTESIGRALQAMFGTGVTRSLPTVITGPPDRMLTCLRNLRRAQVELPYGHTIAGFHIEGPHIGPEDGPRGAHPVAWVRPPDVEEFRRWQDATEGNVRLITISPHWPEAVDYIRTVTSEGVVVSIGHTGADSEQIRAAVNAGATMSTHLGNAAYRLLPKFPNCLWDQLSEDRLYASFIVDGLHLDPAYLRVAVRAKTIARTVLVTDAAAPAGGSPGASRLGELDVELTADDRVVLRGTQKLAGSALRMHKAIENLARMGGVPLRDAVKAATVNPARVIGLDGRQQGLEPGERGDVVVFGATQEIAIEAVYLDGARVA